MKSFQNIEILPAQRIDSPSGHVYVSPKTGRHYPSVTAVTSCWKEFHHLPDPIREWKNRVGEKVAAEVSREATGIGANVHAAIEKYMKTGETTLPDYMFRERLLLTQVLPVLEEVDNVICLEAPLYSDSIELGGTTDCIAEYEGELAVIDWKTAKNVKALSDIKDYFMQLTYYAFMFWEMTGIFIKKLVVVMTSIDSGCAVYTASPKNYVGLVRPLIEFYKNK